MDRHVIMERDLKNMHIETRIMCQLLPIFSLQNMRNSKLLASITVPCPQADFRNRFMEDIFRNGMIFFYK